MTVSVKQLRDNRNVYLSWIVVITAVAVLYAALWPVFGGNSGLTSLVNGLPQAMKDAFHMDDYSTAVGYFSSTVFGLLVPILMAVFAIAAGTRAIAGDEEAGTLDLVLAHPVGRTRLALARFGAVVIAIVGAGALLLVVMLAIREPAKFGDLSVANLLAVCVQLTLFGICFAAIAFGIGAYTGRRVITLGSAAYIAVVSYIADSFLPQISALGWTRNILPFGWYLNGEPLRNGIQWGNCALLVGLAVIFVAVGVWQFDRRDLTA
jgi:ABC-2 type transport system permease protein